MKQVHSPKYSLPGNNRHVWTLEKNKNESFGKERSSLAIELETQSPNTPRRNKLAGTGRIQMEDERRH